MSAHRKIRALVVDDEPLARRRLLSMLAAESDVQVIGEAGSGSTAVEMISTQRPDLVFLDVHMPVLDGFGVLRCTARAHVPAIVFVTAHDEHAIRAFDVQAVDYLVKPVSAARLHEAVRRAIARVRDSRPTDQTWEQDRVLTERDAGTPDGARIPIRCDGIVVFVRVVDIDWVEADGDHIRIHAGPQVHTLRESLVGFAARFTSGAFVRAHRSIIVNTARIRSVESVRRGGYVLVLADGTRLRSGRTYHAAIQRVIR